MKKLLFLTSGGLLFFCMSVSGQVNTDSLSLVSAISKDQLQLGKLQNQLEEKTNNKHDASEKAQNAADKNSTAADKLSENPNSKKLARKAKKEARAAKKDSRNARIESGNLDQLNKDIRELEKRIANNQVKLDKYIKNGTTQRTASDTLRTQLECVLMLLMVHISCIFNFYREFFSCITFRRTAITAKTSSR